MSTKDLLAAHLADTYALFLKTQNYHWHVKGISFKSLHDLFEEQYKELFVAVDDLAERIVTLGGQAPASFKALDKLASIADGDANHDAKAMLKDLADSHQALVDSLQASLDAIDDDEGTVTLLGDRLASHQKMHWMLEASAQ